MLVNFGWDRNCNTKFECLMCVSVICLPNLPSPEKYSLQNTQNCKRNELVLVQVCNIFSCFSKKSSVSFSANSFECSSIGMFDEACLNLLVILCDSIRLIFFCSCSSLSITLDPFLFL